MDLRKTSEFIVKRRKELKLTQEEIAKRIGISAKAVSKWERGLSFPSIDLIGELSVVLKCSIPELLNGEFHNSKSSYLEGHFDTDVLSDDVNDDNIVFDFNSYKYVSPLIFGNNLEHSRNCLHEGISAQMLENRKFAGKPEVNGCAKYWKPVGKNTYTALVSKDNSFASPYTRHAEDYHMQRMLECNSLKITSFDGSEDCGVCQSELFVEKDKEYTFSIAVKSFYNCNLKISLLKQDGSVLCTKIISLEKSDKYEEKELILKPCVSCDSAVLSITFDVVNTVVIGAVSLMPTDNFHGMRKDVIECMKKMGISILRWPGGNFAGDYNWKDGLLPSNMRAPFQAYLWLDTQPHSMGYDFHEINTDDFIALCREIGAEPFITINPTWNTPEESAQWVEYCNGDETTEYGRIRISRGYEEPYNVTFWSLGNEFGYGHMEGNNAPYEYSKTVRAHAEAMLKVSPSLSLCSSGHYPDMEWVNHSAKPLSDVAKFVSFHHYQPEPELIDPKNYKEDYNNSLKAVSKCRDLIRRLREQLHDDSIMISFDEWNIWYAWHRPENVYDGIITAATLHMLINEAEISGIGIVCHFEAVNEGAIVVDKASSKLTPMGKAFEIMKHHSSGKILYSNNNIIATKKDETVTITLINTSYDQPKEFKIPVYGNSIYATLYSSKSILPHSAFDESDIVCEKENSYYKITMPPHSMAYITEN